MRRRCCATRRVRWCRSSSSPTELTAPVCGDGRVRAADATSRASTTASRRASGSSSTDGRTMEGDGRPQFFRRRALRHRRRRSLSLHHDPARRQFRRATTTTPGARPTARHPHVLPGRPALLPGPDLRLGRRARRLRPFFAVELPFSDGPYVIADGTEGAIWLRGHVLDGTGDPVPDAMVETWQADPQGNFRLRLPRLRAQRHRRRGRVGHPHAQARPGAGPTAGHRRRTSRPRSSPAACCAT